MKKLNGSPKIDTAAITQGVEKTFYFPEGYGPEVDGKPGKAKITIKFRFAGSINVAFVEAIGALQAANVDSDGNPASVPVLDVFGAVYDTCVLSWSTDLQAGGEAIEASRENFLWLCNTTSNYSPEAYESGRYDPNIAPVMGELLDSVYKIGSFYAETKAQNEKN